MMRVQRASDFILVAAFHLIDVLQSLPMQDDFNVTFHCDDHVTRVPCPELHDGDFSTCCVEPSCRIMSCDIDVTFGRPLSGSVIRMTSYPPVRFLHVLTANGEAITLEPNSTVGPTASFPLKSDVRVYSVAFYTRRLCEYTISGTSHADAQGEGMMALTYPRERGEDEGPSIVVIVCIIVVVIIFIVVSIFIAVVGLSFLRLGCRVSCPRHKDTPPNAVGVPYDKASLQQTPTWPRREAEEKTQLLEDNNNVCACDKPPAPVGENCKSSELA